MSKRIRLLFFLPFLALTSCFIFFTPGNLTDNAFEDLNDSALRLIMKIPYDTLYKTQYEEHNNLAGEFHKLLSTTEQIDTNYRLGIYIKFWTKIVMNEKGSFYGEYPKNGLLDKIDTLKIYFSDGNSFFDLTPFLKGDSTIHQFKWRKKNIQKGYFSTGYKYFENIDVLKSRLNKKGNLKDWISGLENIFWIDKKVFENLSFKPSMLQMKLTLVDTTGTVRRNLTDFVKLN